MTTETHLRARRITRAQTGRTAVAKQVRAAVECNAPTVTLPTDALVTLLADVDAALSDAERLHNLEAERREGGR